MKVLVCGSRSLWGNDRARQELFYELDEIEEYASHVNERVFVIHGACPKSPDIWGAEWQKDRHGDAAQSFPANWREHGWEAGFIRNSLMIAENPLFVVACWDGESNGTLDTIQKAATKGIAIRIPARGE